ncbi:pyridoxamine 5'-phosphate oxidase [bacterium (Candidatus Blackallbacteria) CG17_big_fil_post_rev_8_21_14_2_50_48_46]|uniref:Pyridoxamine 5'-phosphate oxidase n=1 Tax=bacterium (Candidatus Blackallbacteria) CG17_big_fil_post_rev_8_21_14_2_50_48_46 TaxID=2014261 RepID=A0A2M7G1B7_9BACT|nr:MAG: pyridoxamine 5'-phosphate oxidase [bacterium (Candidatus Blackallbacteria) CG18_big_fil_WC_8_21_14_2_50_49_26]PIW15486.1 MAG: pyridoxamine 5'-phosphate oxidase [bacterium (Candidatus Blackallbacteria) CG17_big_fil_post_rev_8_21_14_2_50_48_46]PIW48614.1 MAG: pyridoxamine 5'-phosphate oxidase [bacterium (Candidatus Blackallbacteria) CG13_big_fil_rev_8_21_14_2_50_49_14]
MKEKFAELRKEYRQETLTEADLKANPFEQFHYWLAQSIQAGLTEPNAMILSTASLQGIPSSRTVLLKELDTEGFVFFTNYASRKGQEIAENAQVSLLFYWPELERQVRIQGQAEKLTTEESDTYFASRPRGSQLGAWASKQSEVISGRETLEDRLKSLETQFADSSIPRPEFWGGYRVKPSEIEFWQGRPNRLHDRLSFRKSAALAWQVFRLSP